MKFVPVVARLVCPDQLGSCLDYVLQTLISGILHTILCTSVMNNLSENISSKIYSLITMFLLNMQIEILISYKGNLAKITYFILNLQVNSFNMLDKKTSMTKGS